MNIKFGPAGLGSVKDAVENLKKFSKLRLKACEIEFVRQIYIKDKDCDSIKETAKELDIQLSIHAPYFINLNSKEKKIIEDSKKRIIECCRIGEKLGAYCVVFHAGYYGDKNETETYENIKSQILEMQHIIKKNNWKIKLAPETMGKVNVFGSISQISKLVKDTGCCFCIDFAHILARDKKVDYEKIKELFKEKQWHCHFSGIEYTEKGERNHIKTKKEEWKNLFLGLPKDKEITIINESPYTLEDSFEGLKIFNKG